jgi:hypothetical protein
MQKINPWNEFSDIADACWGRRRRCGRNKLGVPAAGNLRAPIEDMIGGGPFALEHGQWNCACYLSKGHGFLRSRSFLQSKFSKNTKAVSFFLCWKLFSDPIYFPIRVISEYRLALVATANYVIKRPRIFHSRLSRHRRLI